MKSQMLTPTEELRLPGARKYELHYTAARLRYSLHRQLRFDEPLKVSLIRRHISTKCFRIRLLHTRPCKGSNAGTE